MLTFTIAEGYLSCFFYFLNIMQNVPFYDFPHSPILWLGFGGIIVALAVLFVANRDYFNSPLNNDK
tara:strand:- start:1215 stop:1412 length:198 start_codon:yes stop_codon:yes gene_type:complete